jgi:Ca-activated chloride channel homolog
MNRWIPTSCPKTVARIALTLLIGLGLGACERRPETTAASEQSNSPPLTILATSDLRDVAPLADKVRQATGVTLKFRFGATMDSTEAVLEGRADADVAWFANGRYLLSTPKGQSRVKLQEKIMLSPIAIGVSESDAQRQGWTRPDLKLTWKDITRASRDGKLRYALTNPATSNQGFMSLMAVVAASSGTTETLTAADVDRQAIADFLKGYKLPGDNSTELAERFAAQQGLKVNAFINYESWLLSLNASGKLREKLVLIYPFEGISTADYPIMLLNDSRRADFTKVVEYLKGDEAQTWLARQTLRRPIRPEVATQVESILPRLGLQVELPFSPDASLADSLISAYLNEFRTPIASTFVIDVSGSMNEANRRHQLIESLQFIAGADSSLTGRLARLSSRERLWLLPFSHIIQPASQFEIPVDRSATRGVAMQQDSEAKRAVLTQIRDRVDQLQMGGTTAIYDATLHALGNMLKERQERPGYQYSVVIFTDGENNAGRNYQAFERDYKALPEDVRGIPVFWILFGEANEDELQRVAKLTGGRVFDARNTPLSKVFKDIRAYQ